MGCDTKTGLWSVMIKSFRTGGINIMLKENHKMQPQRCILILMPWKNINKFDDAEFKNRNINVPSCRFFKLFDPK